jgi:D-proline reductase (dithiol) PrdB
MPNQVDSYRFLTGISKRLVKSWAKREPAREIPWTPLPKPLNECTVALISSAGIALRSDRPFDQEGERQNPWWGDPSHRVLPRTATEKDVRAYHLHINPAFAQQDLNALFPLGLLLGMEENGEIGRSADSHYSFMGYNLQPGSLLDETTPAIVAQMRREGIDLAVLIPV